MSRRQLGVVGTMVWDRFTGPREPNGPYEAWGGIAYALAALSVALPDGWAARPIMKVGRDLVTPARSFLGGIRMNDASVVVVPEANNRVELRYETPESRSERLTGGVPAWTWPELAPHVAECDALLVNFISGYELDLTVAMELRSRYAGPVYADLHSLFLGKDADGVRVPRPLPDGAAWLRCFDAIQVNCEELALLVGPGRDPWTCAEEVVASGPSLLAVTCGSEGARCFVSERAGAVRAWSGLSGSAGVAVSEVAGTTALEGDPTGCGDVWGAVLSARLLAGDALRDAMTTANRLASVNVSHRGADTLAERLERETHPKAQMREAG